MKKIFFLLFTAMACTAQAQVSSFSANFSGALKMGTGYVHDFPGLNGIGAFAEYTFPLNEFLQGGIGIRRVQNNGYPRTATEKEYTKSTALDFNLLFVPFHSENAALRIGAGYSFSFYQIRRTYPIYNLPSPKDPNWQVQDAKGRSNGISLTGEYEYYFEGKLSAGVRVSLSKAFTNVVMAGPFVSVRL